MARPGWHNRGYLPHCDNAGFVQHVVFRLADSLPSEVMAKLELLDRVERFTRCDRLLDSNLGSTVLREPEIAQIVVDSLLWFDGQRYAVIAWCVMPNHVHIVVEPQAEHTLSQIMKSLKAFTAMRINKALAKRGRLWAPEYFDRYMRSDEHLAVTVAYVENNPVAAGLCTVPADWVYSSAAARVGLRV